MRDKPASSASPPTKNKAESDALEVSNNPCVNLDHGELFELLAATIDDVLWVSTPGVTQMLYVSPAYERIWGRSAEELYREPHSFIEAIHPDDRPSISAALKEHAKGNWEHEYRIVKPSGEIRWIYDRGYPIRDNKEAGISCLLGIASDITDYKNTTLQLERVKNSLAEAQRIAHLGNWDWNITDNSLWWSDEIYRIFALQPQQFNATYDAFLERVHPDDREKVKAAVNRALDDREEYSIDHRIVLPDGSERTVHERGEVVFDAQQQPVRMIGTVIDVTESRKKEQALKRANRALHTLSRCNEVLVHADQEQRLLEDICRTIVEQGGYRMAWVGYLQNDPEGTVRPMAYSGQEEGYMQSLQITLSDEARGHGPVGNAIREESVQIVRDVQSDPSFLPWREAAVQRNFHSVISVPLLIDESVLGALSIYASEADAFDEQEIRLLEEMASDLGYGIKVIRLQEEHEKANERRRKLLLDTIGAMALTIEKRDPYTAGHQARVAQLSGAIAEELGYDAFQVEGLKLAASIHDVGKIYVPSEILNRPGQLTDPEFELIKSHVEVGYDILYNIDFPWPVAEMVNQHHERLDGSGYPNGLKGDEILPEAKILAVADVVEAIQSHRPYRPSLGMDTALREIELNKGKLYDPAVVDACLRVFREKQFEFDTTVTAIPGN